MIAQLVENYQHRERTLVEELKIDDGSGASSAAEIWQPVFKSIIPTKYNVEQNVYVIDSYNNFSEKVSLAIYDEQYTPYIFNYGTIKYIPIEAVFAVVLCEDAAWLAAQEKLDYKDEQCKEKIEPRQHWLCKMQKLKTDMNAYVRLQSGVKDTNLDKLDGNLNEKKQAQTSTRPITILYTSKELTDSDHSFDIVLRIEEKCEKKCLVKEIPKKEHTLHEWFLNLNHYGLERYAEDIVKSGASKQSILEQLKTESQDENNGARTLKDLTVKKEKAKKEDEQVLLSFMFQLNQLLMLINNPMFFPHASYVNVFNKGSEKANE